MFVHTFTLVPYYLVYLRQTRWCANVDQPIKTHFWF